MAIMEKRIYGNYPPLAGPTTDEARDAVLRYLAQIASEVTSGKLDPARVNWRYIRSQICDAMHHH